MLPIAFEWQWNIDHGVFFGLFYLALTVVGMGITAALAMTFYDLYSGKEPHDEDHEEHNPWEGYGYSHDLADRGQYS